MQDEWGLGHYGSVSYTTLLPPNIFSIFHCKKAKACPLCIHKAGNIKIKLTLYSNDHTYGAQHKLLFRSYG